MQHSMLSTRRGLLASFVASFALAATVLVLASSSASAVFITYCNWGTGPYSYCRDSYTGTQVMENQAFYIGSGTTNVCARSWRVINGAQISDRCGNNGAGTYTDTHPYRYENTLNRAYNNSPYSHTITGQISFF